MQHEYIATIPGLSRGRAVSRTPINYQRKAKLPSLLAAAINPGTHSNGGGNHPPNHMIWVASPRSYHLAQANR